MSRSAFACVVLFLAGSLLAAQPPKSGEKAPAFRLLDQNDQVVPLSSASGHKAVVVFYRGYW